MRRLGVAVVVSAALALTGCSVASVGANPTGSQSPSASPTPSATPTPTPSPTPKPTKPISIVSITPYPGLERGIAQPIIVKFSRSIPRDHRAEVERALLVQESKPTGLGAWRWWAADEVHFRPETFWPAHSTLTLDTTPFNNLNLGYGYYGVGLKPISWPIGRAFVTYVNGKTDYIHVFQDGKLVRTMATSLGKPGWETRSGIKVVQERYRVKLMTGASIQAETNYSLHVPYAVRLTATGEFIHGAPWALYRLGKFNGSHGCTNLNVPDAEWFYYNSMPGDPVITSNTGRSMELWNMFGDWAVNWTGWLTDSSAGPVQVGPAGQGAGMAVPAYTIGPLPPQPAPTKPPNYNTPTPKPTPKPAVSKTPAPTHTPTPTHPPKPTPKPTHTPKPTAKPTPSHTPSPTPTSTPSPSPSV